MGVDIRGMRQQWEFRANKALVAWLELSPEATRLFVGAEERKPFLLDNEDLLRLLSAAEWAVGHVCRSVESLAIDVYPEGGSMVRVTARLARTGIELKLPEDLAGTVTVPYQVTTELLAGLRSLASARA